MLLCQRNAQGWYPCSSDSFSNMRHHITQDQPEAYQHTRALCENPDYGRMLQLRVFKPLTRNLIHSTGPRAWLLISQNAQRYSWWDGCTDIRGQFVTPANPEAYTYGLFQLLGAVYRNTPSVGQTKLNLLQDALGTDWLHHYAAHHTPATVMTMLMALDI